jgi:hypothetical protein
MASFRSKYDASLLVLTFGISLVFLRWVVTDWRDRESTWSNALLTVLALLLMVTLIWTLAVMRYDLTATTLEIRSGPLLWRIPIASIRLVEPSRELGSAPAWSMDRLRVIATGRTVLISPRDKAGFIDALSARDAGLLRDGERLVRSAGA